MKTNLKSFLCVSLLVPFLGTLFSQSQSEMLEAAAGSTYSNISQYHNEPPGRAELDSLSKDLEVLRAESAYATQDIDGINRLYKSLCYQILDQNADYIKSYKNTTMQARTAQNNGNLTVARDAFLRAAKIANEASTFASSSADHIRSISAATPRTASIAHLDEFTTELDAIAKKWSDSAASCEAAARNIETPTSRTGKKSFQY